MLQKNFLFILLIAVLAIGLSACGTSTGNPTASSILKRNPDADIFKFNDLVYSNASDVEWLQEKDYTKGAEIGEIKSQRSNRFMRTVTIMVFFENLANVVGTSASILAFTVEVLGRGTDWWGYINASYWIGGMIGVLLSWH